MVLVAAILCAVAAHGAAVTVVRQIGRAFSVPAVQIARGDTIQFSNDDSFDHQVAVTSPSFNVESAAQPPGSNKLITFPVAGTFDVYCEIHPRMHLAVTGK